MRRSLFFSPVSLAAFVLLSGAALRAATHFQILKSFGNPDLAGQNPSAALIVGTNGEFYGTTFNGGSNGYGTLFRFNASKSRYEVLHHFGGTDQDGKNPQADLLTAD